MNKFIVLFLLASTIRRDYHVIIGVPAAVVAFGLYGVFRTKNISIVVFDSADITATSNLLQRQLLEHLPAECQKVYISNMKKPKALQIAGIVEEQLMVSGIKLQRHIKCLYVAATDKVSVLRSILIEIHDSDGKAVVFFSVSHFAFVLIVLIIEKKSSLIVLFGECEMFQKNETAIEFSKLFRDNGFDIELICREMTWEDRELAYKRFSFGNSKILFATDTIATSLNVDATKIVVHFDLPYAANRDDPCYKLFLNRSTRSGRFGQNGLVLTLIDSNKTFETYKCIAKYYGFEVKSIQF